MNLYANTLAEVGRDPRKFWRPRSNMAKTAYKNLFYGRFFCQEYNASARKRYVKNVSLEQFYTRVTRCPADSADITNYAGKYVIVII